MLLLVELIHGGSSGTRKSRDIDESMFGGGVQLTRTYFIDILASLMCLLLRDM
jgi:hypothetical protein